MPDSPPDHLSNNPRNPFFKEDVLKRDIGVRFNGIEKTNVEEYCVSEGWVRVEVGKTKDRYGNPMTIKLTGKVEPYFKDQAPAKDTKAETQEKPAASEQAIEVPPPARTEKPAKAEKPAKTERPAKPKASEKPGKSGKAEPKKAPKKKAKK